MTAAAPLTLLPAVDVAAGRAAQVVDGGTDDPFRVAMGWVERGAQWIHLVDLDRAFGRGDNADLLEELVTRLPVPVQLSGGLGTAASIEWAAGTQAARLVLASSTLGDADLLVSAVERHGRDRVVAAVDVRQGRVVSRGTGLDLGPVHEVLPGHPVLGLTSRMLVADAARDGSRQGSDVTLFAEIAALGQTEVTASGGVAKLADLRALRALTGQGVTEAVLGAALYHDEFTLEQALEVCR
ncbi:HisA/HisF-related TIM barrel protein [Ornithinimicrobium sufpigmenti]|uniref:HisA/HisF-related TIM barrel protein n=1 Tax=Ornithinimicrobium sufpigmenti TaxID=2508882 RepID=UPI0015E17931|nr:MULTISPECIES: HisA/HisF-related TIM barrel protein [unclassified Ornithinimicrobium]